MKNFKVCLNVHKRAVSAILGIFKTHQGLYKMPILQFGVLKGG